MKTRPKSQNQLHDGNHSIKDAHVGDNLGGLASNAKPEVGTFLASPLKHQQLANISSQAVQLKERAAMMADRDNDASFQRMGGVSQLQRNFESVRHYQELANNSPPTVRLKQQTQPMSVDILNTPDVVQRSGQPNKIKSSTLMQQSNFNFAPVRGLALQRKGERTAVKSTLLINSNTGARIRRGNRRGSVDNTLGKSSAKLAITYGKDHPLNTGYRNKLDELKEFVITKLVERKYKEEAAREFIEKNDSFVQAAAIQAISVGNCGEFANVVFAHLVENTTGQWIAQASLKGKYLGNQMDHAFVVTYPGEFPNATVAGLDKKKATIADAWDNYSVMTLEKFMDSGNAYRTKLHDDNIALKEKREAKGRSILSPNIIADISSWAFLFNKEFNDDMNNPNSIYASIAKKRGDQAASSVSNIPGMFGMENDSQLNDYREFMETLENSTDIEKTDLFDNVKKDELFRWLSVGDNKEKYLSKLSPALRREWDTENYELPSDQWDTDNYDLPSDKFDVEP